MRGTSRVILVGLAALLVGTAVFTMTRGSGEPLEGSGWALTGWSVSLIDPADVDISADFADGRISGSSGVNRYTGGYTASATGDFSVGELASTMMAGPEPAMQAETAYLELLRTAREFRIEQGELTLLDANGNVQLTFAETS